MMELIIILSFIVVLTIGGLLYSLRDYYINKKIAKGLKDEYGIF